MLNIDENKLLSQSEKMQKFALLGEDNTEVIVENKEDGETGSNLGKPHYKTHYFEFNLEKGKHMAIQLESESSKFIYHNATSNFLNVNDGNATTIKSLKKGDTLSIVLFFLDGYLIGRFFTNADGVGKGFIMKGKTVKPTIFQDSETMVKASLNFELAMKEKGTPLYLLFFSNTNNLYFIPKHPVEFVIYFNC